MSLPTITRAEIRDLRHRLGFSADLMAERIGLSLNHYQLMESGLAPVTPLVNNALRWVEHVQGAAPSDVCAACDGRGTIRPAGQSRMNGNVAPRIRCEACDGQGVDRVRVAS